MTLLLSMLRRIPRVALFALAGLIQVAAIAYIVIDRAGILRSGTEVTLQTTPVDPRDLLRGDYVVLGYAIGNAPTGELRAKPAPGRNAPMFVQLTRGEDGFHRAVAAHLAPVPMPAGDVLIRGRAINGMNCGKSGPEFCPTVGIRYGIEKYFVPEGEGREIESARNQGKVTIVAAVAPDGRAAIKRLLLDGKPLYDEPLY
jgi:uncharacterized membrane-anchored protein